MITFSQTDLLSNKSEVSIGFDTNILMDAINKSVNGIELSPLEKNSLDKAKIFLKSIVDFCDGTHSMYISGLSGGEAFSIYVSALNLEGTVDDVKLHASEQIKIINRLKEEKLSEQHLKSIAKLFENISKYINREFLDSFINKNNTGWRI